MRENSMRGDHPNYVAARTGTCPKGHDLNDNPIVRADGRIRCRKCQLENWKKNYYKRKEMTDEAR